MSPRPAAARAIRTSDPSNWLFHAGILLADLVVWLSFAGPARGEETTENHAPAMRPRRRSQIVQELACGTLVRGCAALPDTDRDDGDYQDGRKNALKENTISCGAKVLL